MLASRPNESPHKGNGLRERTGRKILCGHRSGTSGCSDLHKPPQNARGKTTGFPVFRSLLYGVGIGFIRHMPSNTVLGAPQSEALRARIQVSALYVCPGVKDEPIDYAIFPYGSGFTGPAACPGREICLWYAAHDLGGEVEFNDLPTDTLLTANFRAQPFFCPHFRDDEDALSQCRRAAQKRSRAKLRQAAGQSGL